MDDIQALIFDVFGTIVDWETSVVAELKAAGERHGSASDTDWKAFAREWREGYYATTKRIAHGGAGPSSVDAVHRELLDAMLDTPESKWSAVRPFWDEATRQDLTLSWHRLHAWPDSIPGLQSLKQHVIVAALSNGNVRLLVDMAKFANIPWDVIFSAELFNTFKPNVDVYLSTCKHLSLPPSSCAMVAAHAWDLEGAAKAGLKTIYIPRPTEDQGISKDIKAKKDGGRFDLVLSSVEELATLFAESKVGRAQN
ncbi:haloacid dehalogenase [Crepidotus variabilis]|uniref:Haloacid dehalogenase n=1 Tax=Crepidotus variabilis TaxID=179855 RepID=A0A9P6E8G0_9AGAR|nr:haloacid dehalogenase [Crepidotus variabilis]